MNVSMMAVQVNRGLHTKSLLESSCTFAGSHKTTCLCRPHQKLIWSQVLLGTSSHRYITAARPPERSKSLGTSNTGPNLCKLLRLCGRPPFVSTHIAAPRDGTAQLEHGYQALLVHHWLQQQSLGSCLYCCLQSCWLRHCLQEKQRG